MYGRNRKVIKTHRAIENSALMGKNAIQHLAMIMDGNGRWAKKRHLPRLAGHARGVKRVRDMVEACIARKIPYLTLFAFSTENWKRPLEEVTGLYSGPHF
jgi:undecaprenyl diphosphate synthase